MIEINLLPHELKTKPKKLGLGTLSPKQSLYLIAAAFCLLLCLHIIFLCAIIVRKIQLNKLQAKWTSLEPQRLTLDSLKKENEVLSADINLIQKLMKQRLCWSHNLNKLSLDLPSGVWFNELSVNQKEFILKGSAVSLQKEEMGLINKFIDNLKTDQDFFAGFKSLELGPVQRRSLGGYDIVDFILSGALK